MTKESQFIDIKNLLSCFCFLMIVCSCISDRSSSVGDRLFTDALGRQVWIPDTIQRLIPVNESTMRMLCYAGGADRVCGIEDVELRGVAFSHIFANPELRKQPMIGPMFGGDPELIMIQNPDILLTSNISAYDADELQDQLQIPVIVIAYGNLGNQREMFYTNLLLLGELLGTQTTTEVLVDFIRNEVDDLEQRSATSSLKEVYLGGISYRGRHDIFSTDPNYPVFDLLNLNNSASALSADSVSVYVNTVIDIETLLSWNPDVLFIDQGGFRLVKENFNRFPAMRNLLTSYKNKEVYLLWPFYMFHSNFEAILINAWSAGKVIYPDQFADVDLRLKADQIMKQFVGVAVTDSLIAQWGWYRNITGEL